MTRRFSFPASFKNNLSPRRPVSNGCAINIPNDDEVSNLFSVADVAA
jgi:hypothetical protein